MVKRLQLCLQSILQTWMGDSLNFLATEGAIESRVLKLNCEKVSHIIGITASDDEKKTTISFTITVSQDKVLNRDYYKNVEDKKVKK